MWSQCHFLYVGLVFQSWFEKKQDQLPEWHNIEPSWRMCVSFCSSHWRHIIACNDIIIEKGIAYNYGGINKTKLIFIYILSAILDILYIREKIHNFRNNGGPDQDHNTRNYTFDHSHNVKNWCHLKFRRGNLAMFSYLTESVY